MSNARSEIFQIYPMFNTNRIIRLALILSCYTLTQCQQVSQQICYASVLPKAKHVQVVKTSPDYSSRKVLFEMKDGETSDDLQKKLLAIACRQSAYISSTGFCYNPHPSMYSHLDIEVVDGDGKCIKSFSLLNDNVFSIGEIESRWFGEPDLRVHHLDKYFTEEEKQIILMNFKI